MGEDPFLAGHMAANFILGLQSQGVMATVKHFTANNAEYNRHNINAIISERALHEIYLPAFKDAIEIGHAGAVMDSYNLVNGEHSTQNKELNINILRKRWGFKGIVMSDWFATYSAVGAANGGLDLEMPFGEYMNPKNLLPAIKSGKVSIATINDKVRHILREAVLFGFFDRPQLDPATPKDNFENQQVALREALESITLLKNKNHLLPLDPNRVHTIAIIGPDAWPMPEAGGSSHVTPYNSTSFLTGLVRYGGAKIKVLYLQGIPSTADFMRDTKYVAPPSSNPYASRAVKVETFDNPDFKGTPKVTWASNMAGYHPAEWGPSSKHPRSIRYSATFMPKTSGKYIVVAAAGGSDQYKVMVNGKLVLSESTHEGQAPHSTEISLQAGEAAHIVADYQPVSDSTRFGMGIEAADQVVDPEVKQIASLADAAIVSVGFNQHSESEGFDRSFELPFGQNELINAVAAANKNTIVTICAGGNVDMQPWIHNVSAIFDTFYPGQEGGPALAQLIFGEHNPQGHLPASYAADWSQNPTYHNYYGPNVPWGTVEPVKYAEGVYVGYRYYTTFHKPVLFPFGFGLSYTTFSFSHLQVTPENANPSGDITVSFDVTNTGQREGADVAQLYVGDPSAKIKRPVEELKGYQKVRLMPGETQHVVLHLNRSDLAYWSDQKHGWEVDPGKFIAYVGDSSEHLPLQQSFNVQ
jgi:beta-glucosidase